MRLAARSLALFLITSLVACSGGGASAPGGPTTGPPSVKPAGKAAKLGVSIHIPGSLAGTSAGTRRSASGSARPKLVSPASNGLAVLMYSDTSKTTLDYENDFDISGANTTPGATCSDDPSGGGRTCTTTITEPAAQYDFVIETFASPPATNGSGFGSAPSLDSGDAGLYTLSSSQPTTITATLGGTVSAIKLSVPTTFQPYGASTIPIGLTALDAANEVIVSADPYSTPITLGVSSTNSAGTVFLSVGSTTSTQITSTMSSDVISLKYPGGTPTNAGEVISISATSTAGATAGATIAPLYVTAAPTQVIAANPALIETAPASGTQGGLTFTEGNYSGPLTIVADAASPCVSSGSTQASATSPILFNTNGAYTTTPPASITATNGTAMLTFQSGGYSTPGAGCVYDVSDTSSVIVKFTIVAASYTRCPGNNLYVNFDSPESATGNEGLVKYTTPLTAGSTPTQLEGTGQTVWLSFDPSCNAYITDYFSNITQYPSPYTTSAYTYGGSANTDPYGAAVDGYGHLFVDQSSSGSVVEVQMSTNTVLNTLTVPGPYSIAFDSNANLYVGGNQGIYEFAPPYTNSTLVRKILPNIAAQGIAFDASNNLYAVGGNSLTVLAPPYGTANVTATNTTGFSTPLGLAIDTNGNVYVPNYGNSTITAYAPPYTNAPYVTLNVSGALPDSDAMGP